MLEILNISGLPNLKSLTNQLDNLSMLNEFSINIQQKKKKNDFSLKFCDKLESLPGLQNLHFFLWELHIWGCNNLLSLPMNGLRGLSSLQRLFIQCCNKFYSLFEGIQYLFALEDLLITKCPALISFPESIQRLTAEADWMPHVAFIFGHLVLP